MVRILVLIASLVLLLPGAAPALQPGATFRGDPQAVAEVKTAFDRFGALRTYRVRMTTPGREGATVVEFVAPDRFRMQIPSAGQPMEIFVVGTEVWMRTGAACQNLPAAMPGAFNPREVDPNAAQGTMTVSRGGPETVEGTPTQTYAMEVAVQGTLVRQKLYVATGSGLPTVIDYHDQQPTLLMGGQLPPPLHWEQRSRRIQNRTLFLRAAGPQCSRFSEVCRCRAC